MTFSSLPSFLFKFAGSCRQGLNRPVDIRNRYALACKIEHLDDVAHQLFRTTFPKRIVPVANLLFRNRQQRGKQIDDGFQITTAATSAAITTAPIARLTIASASLALKQREDR